MCKKYVRRADEYKKNFGFLSDGTNICNAAYHMQFIEYCFREKRELEKTTRSLMVRTIIIELASIVELCLHELLSDLLVEVYSQKMKQLKVPDKASFGHLLPLAFHYELISHDLQKKLDKLNERRNYVHFKRFQKERILEYNFYTDKMLQDSINIFTEFLKEINLRIKSKEKTFVWPWD